MPEQGTKPVNKYLLPIERSAGLAPTDFNLADYAEPEASGILAWVDRALSKI